MLSKVKIILVVTVALAFTTGITASAQGQFKHNKRPLRQNIQKQQRIGQINPQIYSNQRKAGIVCKTRRMVNAQGTFAAPHKARTARLGQMLNLSNQQKVQIKNLRQQFKDSVKPALKNRREAQRGLAAWRKDPKANEATLRQAAQKLARANNEILDAKVSYWAKFKQILTPEQQAKLQKQAQRVGPGQKKFGQMKQRIQVRQGLHKGLRNPGANQRMNTTPVW